MAGLADIDMLGPVDPGTLGPEFLIAAVGLVFLGLVVMFILLTSTGRGRAKVNKGLQAIDRVYAAGGAVPTEEAFNDRIVIPAANRVTRFGRNLTPKGALERMRRWLDYAGNPPYWTVDRIFSFKGIGLLALGVVGALIGFAFNNGVGAVLGGIAGAALGFYAVEIGRAHV